MHIGAKVTITRQAPRRPIVAEPVADTTGRRRFIGFVGAASTVLVGTTIGQTISPLRGLALLAPRHPDLGTQGLPVNKTAIEADVTNVAASADYAVAVRRGGRVVRSFTIAELAAMTQRSNELPITCVEGWSASKRWTGVSLRDVVEAAGITDAGTVTVGSMQRGASARNGRARTIAVRPTSRWTQDETATTAIAIPR